jgi:hypothetical protein
MNCPYLDMDCTEIDTSGMTKLTDCNDCVHRFRMWNKNIPQRLYLFWDGSPMSWLQMLTVMSFHKYNPTWKIYVYEPNVSYRQLARNTYIPDYTGKDWYPKLRELEYVKFVSFNLSEFGIKPDAHGIQCSDQWRARMLYNNGGMYSDFDVLWLKPMTEFVNIECNGDPRDFDMLVSLSQYTKGYHSNSNLIAEQGSKLLKNIIERQKEVKPPYAHQAYYLDIINRTYPTLESIRKVYPRVMAVQYKTFFPYGLYDLKRLYNKTDLTPILEKNTYVIDRDVMAIHWYNGAKESKDYVNKEDYGRACSMTTILKNEGWLD